VGLNQATNRLVALDVAGWREQVGQVLADWDRAVEMPPSTPERARRLAARSGRVLALLEVAASDEGTSRTASEMSQRAEQLRLLARTARAAHAAAWNAAVDAAIVRR
jgi:hypothetical protein